MFQDYKKYILSLSLFLSPAMGFAETEDVKVQEEGIPEVSLEDLKKNADVKPEKTYSFSLKKLGDKQKKRLSKLSGRIKSAHGKNSEFQAFMKDNQEKSDKAMQEVIMPAVMAFFEKEGIPPFALLMGAIPPKEVKALKAKFYKAHPEIKKDAFQKKIVDGLAQSIIIGFRSSKQEMRVAGILTRAFGMDKKVYRIQKGLPSDEDKNTYNHLAWKNNKGEDRHMLMLRNGQIDMGVQFITSLYVFLKDPAKDGGAFLKKAVAFLNGVQKDSIKAREAFVEGIKPFVDYPETGEFAFLMKGEKES